ncbi:Uncharacterised protein [Mycobacterium tuberculosis]|uniref:Uncharacterized protein n=1 Tax=Mycobacterium tuberculosis TaxID=1773 RepID=A0A655I702_MYCTX|nr:Uncharacterised protein [Mycobacterium tuberculosis]COV96627.1 Uncharacterised protein [Mycobacterium tuberculosis]
MLQAIEHIHRAMLDAVLVSGNEATTGAAVVGVLSILVEQARACVQALDNPFHHRAVVAQPDRPAQHQDVRIEDTPIQGGPFVGRPTVFGHVRPYAGRYVMVNCAQSVDLDAMLTHDPRAALNEPVGMAELWRALQCRVDEQRTQPVESGWGRGVLVRGCGHTSYPPACHRRAGLPLGGGAGAKK